MNAVNDWLSYHRSVYNAINAHVTLNLVCCTPCHVSLNGFNNTFSPASFFIKSHGCLAHLRCSSTYIYVRIASNYTIATYSCRILHCWRLSVSRPCCTGHQCAFCTNPALIAPTMIKVSSLIYILVCMQATQCRSVLA